MVAFTELIAQIRDADFVLDGRIMLLSYVMNCCLEKFGA